MAVLKSLHSSGSRRSDWRWGRRRHGSRRGDWSRSRRRHGSWRSNRSRSRGSGRSHWSGSRRRNRSRLRNSRRSRGRHLHFFDDLLGAIDSVGRDLFGLVGGCLDISLHGFAMLFASCTNSLGISLDFFHRAFELLRSVLAGRFFGAASQGQDQTAQDYKSGNLHFVTLACSERP